MRAAALCLSLLFVPVPAGAEEPAISRLFSDANIEGTIVILPVAGGGRAMTAGEPRASQRFPAASTFKVFNTLIALEEGAIAGKDGVFKWDGTQHAIPDWNRDQTLESAFKVSCVWCYQQLARKVGAECYRRYLTQARYGTLAPDFEASSFWLDGSLQISAQEQAEFLAKVYRQELPFSQRNYAILKDVMLTRKTDQYRIYAKTGWAARSAPPVGWYVGYAESGRGAWAFAMNIAMRSEADLPLRQSLAMAALEAAGVIPVK
jgi:beta-lactamase class D